MTAPSVPTVPNVDRDILQEAIQEEYEAFASVLTAVSTFTQGAPVVECGAVRNERDQLPSN